MPELNSPNDYLPERVRAWLETHYYARVNAQARLECLILDPDFLDAPRKHVGLYSDHGVVHMRDVARQILQVLGAIHGVLIPSRPPERFDGFMKGYGVALAYLHDIGMADFSAFGRAMHPEFAAQAVFTPEFDEWVEDIWAQDCGGMAGRLRSLAHAGRLAQPPETVLRELLALSMGHSKSKIPVSVLNNPLALRTIAQTCVGTDLQTLYPLRKLIASGQPIPRPEGNGVLEAVSRHYVDFERDSFSWLTSEAADVRALVDDVVDTLRALRCADALRQRGTVQKTSGGYEVFISQQTGNAVYALRHGDDQLFLLETSDALSAGEANIAGSEVGADGNLRLNFNRGAFASEAAFEQAVTSTAAVIQDIRADVIESFRRPDGEAAMRGLKPAGMIETLLESTDDYPGFVDAVRATLQRQDPAGADRIQIVPSLQNVPEAERLRYLAASETGWDLSERQAVLARLAQSGHKTEGINPEEAFHHVRLAELSAGDALVEAGAPASIVYVPLGDGLKIVPLGGYVAFYVRAWMPLGNTGVIRGALRNASVVAEQAVAVLMIPKDVYLRHWHHTYSEAELTAQMSPQVFASIEQRAQTKSLDAVTRALLEKDSCASNEGSPR
jgi:hypothetical protein